MSSLANAEQKRDLNRYFDKSFNIEAVKILPGEYEVTSEDVMIVTVLGSCVSACIRDRRLGCGGMNHFMLPDGGSAKNGTWDDSTRYGVNAMEVLLNEMAKLGARRQDLEAKVFGGGAVMRNMVNTKVGEKNAEFVQRFLKTEGIAIASQDLLDIYPRKVYYFPRTGKVLVKKLKQVHNDTIFQREQDYSSTLKQQPVAGEIELFS